MGAVLTFGGDFTLGNIAGHEDSIDNSERSLLVRPDKQQKDAKKKARASVFSSIFIIKINAQYRKTRK